MRSIIAIPATDMCNGHVQIVGQPDMITAYIVMAYIGIAHVLMAHTVMTYMYLHEGINSGRAAPYTWPA